LFDRLSLKDSNKEIKGDKNKQIINIGNINENSNICKENKLTGTKLTKITNHL